MDTRDIANLVNKSIIEIKEISVLLQYCIEKLNIYTNLLEEEFSETPSSSSSAEFCSSCGAPMQILNLAPYLISCTRKSCNNYMSNYMDTCGR